MSLTVGADDEWRSTGKKDSGSCEPNIRFHVKCQSRGAAALFRLGRDEASEVAAVAKKWLALGT
jgi:hypothetical protein